MDELWQLFGEDGRPLLGMGATKAEVFSQGLLHGASHVWIWRNNKGSSEVLLQKRAANKSTWPNRFDISAAGHIDLGEDPVTAALRETEEEIGLVVGTEDIQEIAQLKTYLTAESGAIENEFQWLYLLEMPPDSELTLQKAEVNSIIWKKIDKFEEECTSDSYVPHGEEYFSRVISAIRIAL